MIGIRSPAKKPTRWTLAWASSSERVGRFVSRFGRAWFSAVALLLAFFVFLASSAGAAVYYGKAEALREAFPDAEIEAKRFYLTDEQKKQIEDRGGAPLDSALVTIHVARKGDQLLGYVFLDTHEVRTLPETLVIVVSPSGEVERILIAAFYEPPEYEAPRRWLEQFDGRKLEPGLRINRDIQGIAGSTLTSHAVTSAVRRSLALWEVLVKEAPKSEE
ncbi:MAG: FMN-binding protein [Deltaproteobacteria bacterium]|nr:FMN-binding protein [Deltaproteobacteria bacterium]